MITRSKRSNGSVSYGQFFSYRRRKRTMPAITASVLGTFVFAVVALIIFAVDNWEPTHTESTSAADKVA